MNDLNLSMFRAYDIRTPTSELPDLLAERLARAEAAYYRDVLGVRGVLVARDARASGPHYLELAVDVYTRAGLEVVVIPHVASTCMFYFAAMKHPHLAAVMIGASHNPQVGQPPRILLQDRRGLVGRAVVDHHPQRRRH